MVRRQSARVLLAGVVLAGMACQRDTGPHRALAEADLASVALPIDLSGAVACSTGTWTGELQGRGSYRVFEIQAHAGEILTADLSCPTPAHLLLGKQRDDVLTVLDSGKVDTTAHLALELPEDGSYFLVATSGAEHEGLFTLNVAAHPARAFATGGDPAASYAVIASIEDYPRERVDLQGPHHDAELMRTILVEKFGFRAENVVMLRDEEVTRRTLTQAWLEHLRRAGPAGLALFYFSGHGIQLDQPDTAAQTEDDAKDEALLLADGSVLVDQELGFLADGLRAGRAMIILDNCYAGTGTRGNDGFMKRVFVDKLDFPLRLPDRFFGAKASKGVADDEPSSYVLLAASAEDEVAWVSAQPPEATAPGPVSVFTWYLVDELSSLSASATLAELMDRVHRRTLSFVRRTFGDNQTPHLEGQHVEQPLASFLGPS